MGSDFESRIRNVTAVLGPTNTGKTHLAIERMLGHESGMIGLPLRLLAREVYDKIAARVGADKVALITGEEKIKPERARFWVATVEAMPREIDVDFLAIDEVQLAGDPDRGHVFTDRLLHARGRAETLLLGAQTMRGAIEELIPGAHFISRPRLSRLTYAGEKKITRLPTRTAVVAFSASEVYAIAELIRRQRGGTAVVLGALSPRTRNAQVALYQSGDVDFLVATDAIGMGLNLDLDHVAFSALRKFDGHAHRNLTPGELGQIAGRAGRHMNDGTFGVTGSAEPLEADLIERLETHTFDNVRVLQWRNRKLEFSTLDRLRESLRELPNEQRLTRARLADDVLALETVAADPEVAALATSPAAVLRLWEVCQIPDYRKISSQNHAELVANIYKFVASGDGHVPEDWFARQVAFADRTDGDIDTLANRIAHIRTWTFVSNRADWLRDPAHWQARTRAIEDSLSDALHECLTQRFVDKRTSALMKGMRDKEELSAEIAADGAIKVEDHYVGRLIGFRFSPDTHADSLQGRASRHAATQVLSRELALRVRRVVAANADAFKLTRTGRIVWRDEEISRLEPTADLLSPQVVLLADDALSAQDKEKVQARLETWLKELIADRLKPLVEVGKAEDVTGLARGIAFRLTENLGILKRDLVANDMKALDQPARSQLRKYGVRFGAFNVYFPLLLKPAAADLAATLWALKNASANQLSLDALPEPPRPGLTSVAAAPGVPEAFYRAYGYHVCGPRAVRLDILERLADLIRPLLAWRPGPDQATAAPRGSTGDGGFTVTPEMMSILGCSPDELGQVLKSLGFRLERRPAPPVPAASPVTAEPAADAQSAEPVPADPVAAATTEPATDAGAGQEAAETLPEPAPGQPTPDTAPEPASAAAVEAAPTGESQSPSEPGVPNEIEVPVAVAPTPVAEAAAPALIDIWRPRRQKDEREERRGHHGREQDRKRDRNRHRSHGRPHGTPPATSPQPAAASAAESTASSVASPPAPGASTSEPRREREESRPPRHHQQRRDGGRREGPRDDFRGKRHQHGGGGKDRRPNDRPAVVSASPAKKAGADPDSPFASLGALRDMLERQSREKSTS